MGNDASRPTMSLRPKSKKYGKETTTTTTTQEEEEESKSNNNNGNQFIPKSREDIWEDYFNDDASRMSIVNTDRYADSDQDINEINQDPETMIDKTNLPSSQRSTFAMLTEDSLMLVRSVQKIKLLSEQLYDHYGRGNAPEDEEILDIIRMIDAMPVSATTDSPIEYTKPTVEADKVISLKPPAPDDNTTVTTDDRNSSGDSDNSGKGDFDISEQKQEDLTSAAIPTVVLHDTINNTQAHEEIGKSVSIVTIYLIYYHIYISIYYLHIFINTLYI